MALAEVRLVVLLSTKLVIVTKTRQARYSWSGKIEMVAITP